MASARSRRFIVSPFELSVAPVTVRGTGAGTRTDSSQPGRSIDEPNRPRGLGVRASRIRRPRPGAARTKNPMRVAQPRRRTLGVPPPVEPAEPTAWSGGRTTGSGPPPERVAGPALPSAGCCDRCALGSLGGCTQPALATCVGAAVDVVGDVGRAAIGSCASGPMAARDVRRGRRARLGRSDDLELDRDGSPERVDHERRQRDRGQPGDGDRRDLHVDDHVDGHVDPGRGGRKKGPGRKRCQRRRVGKSRQFEARRGRWFESRDPGERQHGLQVRGEPTQRRQGLRHVRAAARRCVARRTRVASDALVCEAPFALGRGSVAGAVSPPVSPLTSPGDGTGSCALSQSHLHSQFQTQSSPVPCSCSRRDLDGRAAPLERPRPQPGRIVARPTSSRGRSSRPVTCSSG